MCKDMSNDMKRALAALEAEIDRLRYHRNSEHGRMTALRYIRLAAQKAERLAKKEWQELPL